MPTSDFTYCDRCHRSVVCLSICLSRSCIVLKRQKILTRFLLHTTALCIFQIVLKFGLRLSTPFSTNIAPKWQTPVDLSVGDIQWKIAVEWLEITQRSQWRAYNYRKPSSLFRLVPSMTPYDLLFPKIGSQRHPHDQLRDACCHKAIWARYRPSDVAFCQLLWPL